MLVDWSVKVTVPPTQIVVGVPVNAATGAAPVVGAHNTGKMKLDKIAVEPHPVV